MRVPLLIWQDLHLTFRSAADTLGRNALLFLKLEVDDAPLGRGHRLERDHVARGANFVCDAVGEFDEALFAAAAVTVDIDGEDAVAVVAAGDRHVEQVLERCERLAPATDEDAELVGGVLVFADDVEDLRDQAKAVTRRLRIARTYLGGGEAEQRQDVT